MIIRRSLSRVLVLAKFNGFTELVIFGHWADAAWFVLTGLLAFTCGLRTFVLVFEICFLDLELLDHLTGFIWQVLEVLTLLKLIIVFFNDHALYVPRVFPLVARILLIGLKSLGLSVTLHRVLLRIYDAGVLLILLDVFRSIAYLIEMRPIGLALVLVFFRFIVRTKVIVNALHRRSVHVSSIVRATRIILIANRRNFVHDLFCIELGDMHIATVAA